MDVDAVRKTREHYNSHANNFADRSQVRLSAMLIINFSNLLLQYSKLVLRNIVRLILLWLRELS